MDTLKVQDKIEKQSDDVKVAKIKRSYYLTEGCINKLQRMKLEDFPLGTSLESIVEKAIIELYKKNHTEPILPPLGG